MSSVICVICQDSDRVEWSALTCGHLFHQDCLATWLTQRATCPQCNRQPPRPGSTVIRIYFATEDDREQHQQRRQNLDEATGGADEEVGQLRQMLFMETQDSKAGWQQAHDLEKQNAKLRNEYSRETQQRAIEFEELQLCMVRREEQMEEVMRLAALEQRESQERCHQLQLANRSLEESKTQLNQQLQSVEQKNRELRTQGEALQAIGNVISARQQELERQVAQLEASAQSYKRQFESEQRSRQLEADSVLDLVTENSRLASELSEVQKTNAALRSAANEGVNKQKEIANKVQTEICDLGAKFRTATEGFVRSEREKIILSERLEQKELQLTELQMQLQKQDGMTKRSAPVVTDATDRPGKNFRRLSLAWPAGETETDLQDNFSNFPVIQMDDDGATAQRNLQMLKAAQRSTPNMVQAHHQEVGWEYENNPYDSPPVTPPVLRRAGSTKTGLAFSAEGYIDDTTYQAPKKRPKDKGKSKCKQM